jgi:hypothetical protein
LRPILPSARFFGGEAAPMSFYQKLSELPTATTVTFLCLIGVIVLLWELSSRYKR